MSKKNKEAVEGLPFSEEGKAYIACNIELDKALEYLIAELDKAGKLEKTVICLSADHYPYAMDIKNLEELAGEPLEGTLDIYRNSLILWNSEMETVEINKACSALDLMPTLLNLFGFHYDSRLFEECVDILLEGLEEYLKSAEEYLDEMRAVVRSMNNFSGRVLNNNYYHYIVECLPEEW